MSDNAVGAPPVGGNAPALPIRVPPASGKGTGISVVALAVMAASAIGSAVVGLNLRAPLLSWEIELVATIALFVGLGFFARGYWFGILIDGRNKISLSRLQITLWTILFFSTLLIAYLWNVGHAKAGSDFLALDVPDTIWILMGISGVSAAGTPLILSGKPDQPPAGSPPIALVDPDKFIDGVVIKRKAGLRPKWSDILLGDDAGNGQSIDVGKVQQLLFTVVGLLAYGCGIARLMAAAGPDVVEGLPTMSPEFLALIGASHATYLALKAAPHSN